MERHAVSSAVAVLLLLVGILIGAGGYYAASNFSAAPVQTTSNHTTTYSPTSMSSLSSSSTTQTTISHACNESAPLYLIKVSTVGSYSQNSILQLEMTWGNCASQSLQFYIRSSTLSMEFSTLGKVSETTAYLGGCLDPSSCTPVVPTGGSITVELPIYPYGSTPSPNSIILFVSGNLTAMDPAIGAISPITSFRT